MKLSYMLTLSILCLLPQKAYALSCLSHDFTPEVFESIDFIAKGKVSDYWLDKINPFSVGQIPFYLHVEKAWKGASSGEKVRIIYQQSGGDGFPYSYGESHIIYAFKNKNNVLVTDGCAGLYNFPMSAELQEFSQNPPNVSEADQNKLQYISNMRKQLEQLEEETLNEYSK